MKQLFFTACILFCVACNNNHETKITTTNTPNEEVKLNPDYPELDTMIFDFGVPEDKIKYVRAKRFLDSASDMIRKGLSGTMTKKLSRKENDRLMDSVFRLTREMGSDPIIFKKYRLYQLDEMLNWMIENGHAGK